LKNGAFIGFSYFFLALMEVEILFLNAVRVLDPDSVEKDCNVQQEKSPENIKKRVLSAVLT